MQNVLLNTTADNQWIQGHLESIFEPGNRFGSPNINTPVTDFSNVCEGFFLFNESFVSKVTQS